MASILDRKAGFIEWLIKGKESYSAGSANKPGYTLLDSTINHADTTMVRGKGKWAVSQLDKDEQKQLQGDRLAPTRRAVVYGIKRIDLAIQFISGALMFALIKAAAERNRASTNSNIVSGIWIGLGLAARGGLFVSQIIVNALRLPLAIVSTVVGAIWGSFPKQDFKQSVADFLWIFAPNIQHMWAVKSWADQLQALQPTVGGIPVSSHSSSTPVGIPVEIQVQMTVYVLSLVLAVTFIALLATGTLGLGGLAAVPFFNVLTTSIAGGLQGALGFIGIHAATATTVFSIGLVTTMLAGALISAFNQVGRFATDSVRYVMDWSKASTPPSSRSNSPVSGVGSVIKPTALSSSQSNSPELSPGRISPAFPSRSSTPSPGPSATGSPQLLGFKSILPTGNTPPPSPTNSNQIKK